MFLFIFVCGITKNLTLTLKVLIYVETIIKEVNVSMGKYVSNNFCSINLVVKGITIFTWCFSLFYFVDINIIVTSLRFVTVIAFFYISFITNIINPIDP